MNIVHVVVTGAFAGTERYVCDVSGELSRRGHDVSVIGGAPDRMTALLGPEHVRILPGATLPAALLSLLRIPRPDVVHTHLTSAEFLGVPFAVMKGAGTVTTRHIAGPRGSSGPARVLGHLVARRIDRQLAISQFVAQSIGAPACVLLNGVGPADLPKMPRERTVLVAQRLESEKSTDLAIRAWALSGLAQSGWRLRIAGDGGLAWGLRQIAAELGVVASVDFLGQVPDLAVELDTASLLLAPAGAEPLGLTVLEAMAHGLPVIATASGGHLETVGRCDSAPLFPAGDPLAAADLLRAAAHDEKWLSRYGQQLQALQRENFSLADHVTGLEGHYRDVTSIR